MKGLILIFTITVVLLSPATYSEGCGDHGPGEDQECIKDSNGNCVET
ncbi:hypothetical protein OAK75_08105 [Bacteriovoracales bacterium]|nr:hypothetical protein [Bacteriovoracales bacterium]